MKNKFNSCIPLFLDSQYFLISHSIVSCCQKKELQHYELTLDRDVTLNCSAEGGKPLS